MLERLKDELTKAFSSNEYKAERKKLAEETQAEQQRLFEKLSEEAREQGFVLQMTSSGPALIPLADGKPMSQEDFTALEEPQRKEIEEKRNELLKKLQETFENMKELERQAGEKFIEADKAVAESDA